MLCERFAQRYSTRRDRPRYFFKRTPRVFRFIRHSEYVCEFCRESKANTFQWPFSLKIRRTKLNFFTERRFRSKKLVAPQLDIVRSFSELTEFPNTESESKAGASGVSTPNLALFDRDLGLVFSQIRTIS